MAMQLSQQICNLTCIIAAVCPCSVHPRLSSQNCF